MDADTTRSWDSWCLRLGENAVRSAIVALVLTGQMLPAGSVSAQDGPLPPSAASPYQLPTPPAPESVIPPAQAATQAAPASPPPAAPAPAAQPMMAPAVAPSAVSASEETHTLGDWKMTIRPGIVPARPAPFVLAPCPEAMLPQTSVSVPVSVNVHNNAMPYPWLWSVPSTYPTWLNAPTSAYLFQRPRPYWKLRGDFHHLAPFIPGLWYY